MSTPKPLYSQDAEEAILGVVLLDPARFPEIDLSPEEFYLDRNRTLWQAMTALFAKGKTIDHFTIAEQIGEKELAQIGGPAYLTKLIGEAPLGAYAQDIVDRVREFSRRRLAVQIASDLAKASYDTGAPMDAGSFVERLVSLSDRGDNGAVHWGKYLSELYDQIEQRAKDPKDIWGIPTGFHAFDRVTGGLQDGELMILSGKPGTGKSIWAMQVAEQMGRYAPGAIYSVEMSGLQVVRRIVSDIAGVPTRAIKTGRLEDDNQHAIVHAISELSTLPVYMSDNPYITTPQLRADLVRLKARHGIRWFVFDYMLLAQDNPGLDETERSAIISRNMKLACRHVGIPGVVIHSMNKAGMDASRPDQQNLRGSGQVAFDADLIVFLTEFHPYTEKDKYLPKKEQDNMRTLHFGKGRELEDPKKYLHMVKRPGYPSFGDYAGREQ